MHYTKFYLRQLLVDASASMDPHQEAMSDILKEHFGEYHQFASRHPEAAHRFAFSLFNTQLKPVFGLVSPEEMPDASFLDLVSEGDTALFDACWQQIDELESTLREQGLGEKVHVDLHLVTDGVDTASTTVRFADLRQRIEALQSTGRWTFHFHEADLDTIELNALLGLRRQLAETADPRQLREALVEFLTPGPSGETGSPTV